MNRIDHINNLIHIFNTNQTYLFYGNMVFITKHIIGLSSEYKVTHIFTLSDNTILQLELP